MADLTKNQLKGFIRGIWDIFKRSVGLAMVSFLPGAGIGAATPGGEFRRALDAGAKGLT